MSISDRLRQMPAANGPGPSSLPPPPPNTQAGASFGAAGDGAADRIVTDPFAAVKQRTHEALFARLGMRLFDSSLGEEQLRSLLGRPTGRLANWVLTFALFGAAPPVSSRLVILFYPPPRPCDLLNGWFGSVG